MAATVMFTFGPLGAKEQAGQEPRPETGVRSVVAAFGRFPVVALGMNHRDQDEADFSLVLIRDPGFVTEVNDIVIEAGNALYQTDLDRYIAGDTVAPERLQLVWRNTTQPIACESRWNKQLLDVVREVNKRQPPAHRLRVLAGDPPINWDKIRTPADLAPFTAQRDTHFASVVEDQVLAKHRKALLIIGAGHILKRPISWAGATEPPAPTVTMLIEGKYPNSIYVISPHQDFGEHNSELEPRLAQWPTPSVAVLKDSWIGQLEAGLSFRGKIRRIGSDPSKVEDPYPGLRMQDIADAYLYLGPSTSMHEVKCLQETGTAYSRELERRMQLVAGGQGRIAPAPVPSRP